MHIVKNLGILFGAAALATAVQAQTKWDMPTGYPATNFHTENIAQFAADIDKATAGKLKITVHAGGSLFKALQAAETLAADGIAAEVVDLRVLRPLDDATIMASVAKCRRAVIVDEGWRSGSLAAEVMARIVEQAFYELDAPVARVCSEEVPIPYARHMEDAALPQPEKIVVAVKGLFA